MITLSQALGITSQEVIALVGSGGKTSALFQLVREQSACGRNVVSTTTTRMLVPAGELLLTDSLRELKQGLKHIRLPVMVAQGIEADKLVGVPACWPRVIASLPGVDMVVSEADGSRNRPLKFPASYEPVLGDVDLLVLVVGAGGLNKPLEEAYCQRANLAQRYLGLAPGTLLTPTLVAELMFAPQSYGRFLGKYHIRVLINQADTRADQVRAGELARELLGRGLTERVAVCALATPEPVKELYQ